MSAPKLTDGMLRAMREAHAVGFISAWEFSSAAIGALKRRGLIEFDSQNATPGFRGTHYRLTDAGRAALKEGGK